MKTTEPGPRDGPSDGPSNGPAVGSRPPGAKPSRRRVLTVAVTAAAGVAASRLLGLRDLDQRALAASRAADSMAMGVMGDEAVEPPEVPAEPPVAGPTAPSQPAAVQLKPATAPTAAPVATTRPAIPTPRATIAPVAPLPVRGALLDWAAPLDQEAGRIGHLLRRTTFGPTAMEYDRAMSEGYARTLERILETPAVPPKDLADTAARNLGQLQTWWLDHMIASPTPFAEVMTLFLHGRFTSDYRKVGLQQPHLYWQNLTWRSMALGTLKAALKQVTIDPAMLRFLDLGISTGRNPNENYARELMEIFAMGAGTFTEDDVRSGAKALSGWRLPRANETTRTGVYDPQRAFIGTLTYLGRTGTFDTDAVIDQVLKQNAAAPFLVAALCDEFVSSNMPATAITQLATRFRSSGYNMKALLRDVFTSPEFLAPESYRALVKSPVHLMVSLARVLGAPALSRLIAQSGPALGQSLFDPPSVGGWTSNAGWISSNAVIARANFVAGALAQVKELPPTITAHLRVLDGVLGPQTVNLLNATNDEHARWSIILSSAEFQLK